MGKQIVLPLFFKMRDLKKIGVLLPQSKAFPRMSKDFLNGLRLSLNMEEVEIKIEGIGVGRDPKAVIDSIQKLVNQEGVCLTTGLLGHKGIEEILDFVEGIDEKMLYSDFGATATIDLAKRKGILCNSLDLYNSSNLLGKHLVKEGKKNIAVSTCYYDAGYGFMESMERAISESSESQFSGHFITPLHPRENESEIMANFVKESNTDAIFAFYNGVFAKEHASYLKENQVNKIAPLYTLPFTVEERVLNEFPEIFNETYFMSSWTANMISEKNKEFVDEYKENFGSEPTLFSLLGYENGILIQEFINNNLSFSDKELIGPRGVINIPNNSNRTNFTHYLWQLKYENDQYKSHSVEKFNYDITDMVMTNVDESGGWHNAYLCH
jgi:ABC-type branched-subunit amino acid transport system substrate-binding protein